MNPNIVNELLNSVKEFSRVVSEIQPDIVMANTTRALILAALAKKKYKLVNYIRDYDYPRWLVGLLRRKVDKFLMVSKSISSYYQIKKPKSEVIYLGSDINLTKDQRPKTKDFIIGFVGRLVDWKGPLFLLDALLKINNPSLKLVFFGSGKNQAGSVEEKLLKKVKEKSLQKRVKFAGFVLDQSSIYSSIDCFVQASLKPEPFATNMIEAAMSKVPIIATNIGGTPEFIKDHQNGLLVRPNDSNGLARALLQLSQDKNLAKKLAGQAFLDAKDFREEIFIQKLEAIFRKLL